jgi:hypothetical protein
LYGTSFKIMMGCFDGFSCQSEKNITPTTFHCLTFISFTTKYNNKHFIASEVQSFSSSDIRICEVTYLRKCMQNKYLSPYETGALTQWSSIWGTHTPRGT